MEENIVILVVSLEVMRIRSQFILYKMRIERKLFSSFMNDASFMFGSFKQCLYIS